MILDFSVMALNSAGWQVMPQALLIENAPPC